MNNQNPKLRVNVISEALLEIRFNPVKDISLVVGGLNEQLGERYTQFENLGLPDFPGPTPPELDRLVRYRFFSDDRKQLFNIGKGIFSINTLNYQGFSNFREEIERILTIHREVSDLENITRIGLRYINKIPIDREIEKVFTISFNLVDLLKRGQTGFNFRTVNKIKNKILVTGFSTELFNKVLATLDLDCSTKEETAYDVRNILAWLDESHQIIYKVFKSCLTKGYFKSLL